MEKSRVVQALDVARELSPIEKMSLICQLTQDLMCSPGYIEGKDPVLEIDSEVVAFDRNKMPPMERRPGPTVRVRFSVDMRFNRVRSIGQ